MPQMGMGGIFPQSAGMFPFGYNPSMQGSYYISGGTPLGSFCPSSMVSSYCLSQTSFPMYAQNQNNPMMTMMMSMFLSQQKNLSKKRAKRKLSQGSWKSYGSHRRSGRYERIKKEDEDKEREENTERPATSNNPQFSRTETPSTDSPYPRDPNRYEDNSHFDIIVHVPETPEPTPVIVEENGTYKEGFTIAIPTSNIDIDELGRAVVAREGTSAVPVNIDTRSWKSNLVYGAPSLNANDRDSNLVSNNEFVGPPEPGATPLNANDGDSNLVSNNEFVGPPEPGATPLTANDGDSNLVSNNEFVGPPEPGATPLTANDGDSNLVSNNEFVGPPEPGATPYPEGERKQIARSPSVLKEGGTQPSKLSNEMVCVPFEQEEKDNFETEAKAICVDCMINSETQNKNKEALEGFVGKYLHRVEVAPYREPEKICSGFPIRKIRQNFEKTCQPILFNDFYTEVKKQSCEAGIPPEIMLSLMSAESSGRCSAIENNRNTQSVESVGLLQINKDFQNIPTECAPPLFYDDSQIEQIAQDNDNNLNTPFSLLHPPKNSLNLQSLKEDNDKQCLMNPLVSLRLSINTLREKYKKVNGEESRGNPNCEDVEINDEWRKAVAAYNGGEKRVLKSIELLNEHEDRFKQEIPNWNNLSEWEKLRVFFFSCLRGDAISECDHRSGDAIFKNSIEVLAHAEIILGKTNNHQSHFTEWKEWTKKQTLHNNQRPTPPRLFIPNTGTESF